MHGTATRQGYDDYGRRGGYGQGADMYGGRTAGYASNDFGLGVPSQAGPLPPGPGPLSSSSTRYDYGSGGDMRMPPPASQTLPVPRSRQEPQTLSSPRSRQQADMQPPPSYSQTMPSSGNRRLAHLDENVLHEAPLELPGSDPIERPRERPRAQRSMSYLSQEAIDGLFKTDKEVSSLEERAEDINRRFESGQLSAGQARTELANVEAAANKVECDKMDSIYTGELNSGKDQAKALKKDQTKRLDSLHTKFEELFKKFKS